ncbi:hypothetical protein [Actinoplanes sp. NPDC026670]|uniref:hypothetical protein n=1 Tax=Actinoplanes sp. NPDC026670 TaxID=3154700 RepID=UPI00340FD952
MPRERTAPADERLDPVRWHRPSRGTLLRLLSVAVLLITAAAVLWLKPTGCVPVEAEPQASGPAGRASASPGQTQTVGRPIPSGSVGVPVRLADPTALTVVRPGNRVDLLRIESDRDRTTGVASAALVLEVTGADDPVTGGLLLALDPAEARQAIATPGRGFAIVIRPN